MQSLDFSDSSQLYFVFLRTLVCSDRLAAVAPRVSYLVGRLDRLLRRRLGEALAPLGLSLPEYTALSVLAARSGLSNAQLARRSLITPQAANEVLTRLEQRSLVRRGADPAHARIRPAQLTTAGRRLLAKADVAADAVEREMLASLPAPERRALRSSLASALDSLGDTT
ncbi:MAG TPA: MarR family transcriptional regulator [Gaiellaceae bacterium]|nr:MarR family transcriptional regulator [Gaiellaceae bacterium]